MAISYEAIASATGSARAEGVEATPETLELLERMRTGELTADEAVAVIKERYRSLCT